MRAHGILGSNQAMRNLIIIGGNPGSGKTAVSNFLVNRGLVKLGIDDFYQRTPRDPHIKNWFEDKAFLDLAYSHFKTEILLNLNQNKKIVIETTGVGNRWKELLAELESKFTEQIVTIYLNTTRETSKERIRERNKTEYPIKMPDERLDAFFALAKDAASGYQHVIDANGPLTDVFDQIVPLIE
jgi:thymidylate kinase